MTSECCLTESIFKSALDELKPDSLMSDVLHVAEDCLILPNFNLQYDLKRGCRIVGFGKGHQIYNLKPFLGAVLCMAGYLVEELTGRIKGGVLSVPLGISATEGSVIEACRLNNINVVEGAENNLPDKHSLLACQQILKCLEPCTEEDLVIVLISGGGSALLPYPVPGLTLSQKQEVILRLTHAGADIEELNAVRSQLSLVKGGGLANYMYPAQVLTLILSDVIGDPLNVIASGPTVHHSNLVSATAVLEKYNLLNLVPDEALRSKVEVDQSKFERIQNVLIGNNSVALEKMNQRALKDGCETVVLSSSTSGESCEVGKLWSLLATSLTDATLLENSSLLSGLKYESTDVLMRIQDKLYSGSRVIVMGGGETTVKIRGEGKGGRNQEMVLAFGISAAALFSHKSSVDVEFLSCGTDGIDGPTDAAGACVTRYIWDLVESSGLNPELYLENNDSYSFWTKVGGGLVKTGHSGTNLMDVQILSIQKKII
ncbi:glycerate kinase isoform X2 [Eurytemora carolleeae]|uniref:glycerate kinase isoform X2 n=1 Tax=Eurytemora carolleeae TaxID=1294199 RepID=UPI000C7723CE|nr:glycerate kinase isoform X2 [Eurytemora carolleeae]|eukprot:XP_023340492.1 glycerate kinase-like isoform X2 [Eurytemora affinis]